MANSGVDPDEPASGARPRNVNVKNYVTSYFSISRDKQTVRSRSKHMQSDDNIIIYRVKCKNKRGDDGNQIGPGTIWIERTGVTLRATLAQFKARDLRRSTENQY